MRLSNSNIGCTALKEVVPITIVFSIAMMLFASQGLSSFISTEILGFKDGGVPIQVALTLFVYGSMQLFESRFRALPIIIRHRALAAVALSIFLLTLSLARSSDASDDEGKAPFQLAIGLAIFHLGFYFASNPRYLRWIFTTLFLCVGTSGLVALFELTTGMSMPWARGSVVDRSVGEGAQGLEWFPVSYAYSVLPSLVIAGYYLLVPAASYGRPARAICAWCLALGTIGLFTAFSRSGIIGLVAGMSVTYLMAPRSATYSRSRSRPWVAFLGIFTSIALSLSIFISDWSGKNDVAEDARIQAVYHAYLPVVITNPIGVSDKRIQQINTFFDAQEQLGLESPVETILIGAAIAPHNGFMTAGIRYGWLGIAFGLGIFATAIGRTWRSVSSDINGLMPETHLQVAITGALIALLGHVWFHNMSILTGDMRNWFPFGIAFGCLNIKEVRLQLIRRYQEKMNQPPDHFYGEDRIATDRAV